MLHGAVGWVYLVSGLVAPGWAVVGLLTIWVALLVVAIRVWRSRPLIVLGIPFLAMAIWFVTLFLGERLLDWTA